MKTHSLPVLFVTALAQWTMAAAADWEIKVDLGSLFPSYIISTATVERSHWGETSPGYYGDPNGQVGVVLTAPNAPSTVEVEISSPKAIRKSVYSGSLSNGVSSHRIYPEIDYDFDYLYGVVEPHPETITVRVMVDGTEVGTKRKTVLIRSINDCLLSWDSGNGSHRDFSWTFAAYVNENHPLVDQILKEALDLRLVSSFAGYQSGPSQVYEQVFAVWNVLQRRGIKYSSITTPSVVSQSVFSQHVRTFEDAIANSQANCVDGSVLFASVFRKIGFHTFLVLVPGHCFVGIVQQPDPLKLLLIETTEIGNADLREQSIDRGIESFLSGRSNNRSRTSFERAVAHGEAAFKKAIPGLESKAPGYKLIPIEDSRLMGVYPLRSRGPQPSR